MQFPKITRTSDKYLCATRKMDNSLSCEKKITMVDSSMINNFFRIFINVHMGFDIMQYQSLQRLPRARFISISSPSSHREVSETSAETDVCPDCPAPISSKYADSANNESNNFLHITQKCIIIIIINEHPYRLKV